MEETAVQRLFDVVLDHIMVLYKYECFNKDIDIYRSPRYYCGFGSCAIVIYVFMWISMCIFLERYLPVASAILIIVCYYYLHHRHYHHQQILVWTRVNYRLALAGEAPINSLRTGLKDGVVLVKLIEEV